MPVIKHELAPDLTIYEWHVIDGLRLIPDKSVQCVVTSDPYWGLRDYGNAVWEGGDPACDHAKRTPSTVVKSVGSSTLGGGKKTVGHQQEGYKEMCPRCGARRVDNQVVDWPEVAYSPMPGLAPITVQAWRGAYGMEPTPEMYVGHSVLIRRELRRTMRDDAVQWLNLGDSYANDTFGAGGEGKQQTNRGTRHTLTEAERYRGIPDGLKRKDLVGIPWRVALALQADGWYLRSDVIWNKPNPMPESATDRPTKAHEYVFLLSKSQHYFYDATAIQEPSQDPERPFRNKRSVWTIATQSFPEAHFATFPEELPETCILAGTSPKACPKCLAPWERVAGDDRGPTCTCAGNDGTGKCTVLDLFGGSMTTIRVAMEHGRAGVACELNPKYVQMGIRARLDKTQTSLLGQM